VRLDADLAGSCVLDVGCYSISGARLAADTNHRGIQVAGTRGSFSLSDPWRNETRRLVVDDEVSEYPDENQYRLELDDFAAAIRGERRSLLGWADALGQARTIEALRRSARSGLPVSL
jgi:predicted dehydrogenase